MRRMLVGWVVLGLAIPLPAAEPESSLLKLLPDGAVAAAEVNRLGARVKQLRLSGFPKWLVDQQRDSGPARQPGGHPGALLPRRPRTLRYDSQLSGGFHREFSPWYAANSLS